MQKEQNPHGGGLCEGQWMGSANAILSLSPNPLNTINTRTLSRLEFQLRKIRRLHQQASENGIELDPAACQKEIDDVLRWAAQS